MQLPARYLTSVSAGVMFWICSGLFAQKFDTRHPVTIPSPVCVGIPVNSFYVVPDPKDFKSRLKSGRKTANIVVTYTGFSDQAKTAFQYAVDIWSTIISSPVTIHIDARWEALSAGVLGNCSPANYYYLVEGSRDLDKFYPVTLAEKITGQDINGPNDADIIARFNSANTSWSFATNGLPVANKYDLVTVVLHEICHGLGYVGSMYVDNNGIGSYGLGSDNLPVIFDKYIATSTNYVLIDTSRYRNYSLPLAAALQSDNLYFQSPMAYAINASKYPKLYTPVKWNGGSSIYHLDDGRYDNTINALMTHAVNYAEVVHDPGPLSMAMLNEMGWINTWIKHDTLPDVETWTSPLPVKAVITSDTLLIPGSMQLHYSTNNFISEVGLALNPDGKANEFVASIPVPAPETRVSYYITVTDTFHRTFTSPSGIPDKYHSFYFGKDTTRPVIEHQPIPYVLTGVDSLSLKAIVTDNLGLKSVYTEYFLNGIKQDSILLQKDTLDYYSGKFHFDSNFKIGDSINYRIVAIDASKQLNTTFSPSQGYYTFKVEEVPAPQTEYSNDFNNQTKDFLMDGFSIDQPGGMDSPGLNSEHPYLSPNVDGKTFEFVAQLRIPVILRPGDAYMKFDEVALVEPGENGSLFATDNFYDYVVVEGSKDGGNTWNYFEEGWDCRAFPDWLNRWNSATDSKGNSTAQADNSLLKTRKLNMLANSYFSGGDTVLIRFRLHSDPYANGWGWYIDNLGIQGLVSSASNMAFDKDKLSVYPNPASDFLAVSLSASLKPGNVKIVLTDLVGKVLYTNTYNQESSGMDMKINLQDIPDGLYLLTVSSPDFLQVRKIIVRK